MQPLPDEDIEEFSHRMTALAWFNGENSEREAFAALVRADERRKFAKWLDEKGAPHYAEQIRYHEQGYKHENSNRDGE